MGKNVFFMILFFINYIALFLLNIYYIFTGIYLTNYAYLGITFFVTGHLEGMGMGGGAPQVICALRASLGLFSLVFDRVYYATNSDSLSLERAASA